MSWKKHFTPVPTDTNQSGSYSPLGNKSMTSVGPASSNYNSYLPDVYVGSPNRIERYGHYNTMDLDSEVNAALDILAEFCTQVNDQNGTAFRFNFNKSASNSEVQILSEYLKQWYKLNKFETRMFRIMRNTFKYGDQIFIRDPETKKLFHIEPAKLKRIIVNESEGKIPEQYIIDDINFNFKNLVATSPHETNSNIMGGGSGYLTGGVRGMIGGNYASQAGSRFQLEDRETAVSASHVLHLSLSEGLDANYPFGNSLLETVFKVYKQKELLEDAIIIYRVQRAPERRVFYVDVGNMPPHLAMQFVERVKTEIHQRRIPSATGGGQNVIDSSYNPLSIHEDYFFPQSAEGRGSKVETLPGGCLAMDTNVSLLDGREMSIKDIEEEMKVGKELWTYSVDPDSGAISPGLISWAGVTHQRARVMKLTFDNNESVICTPDHKFPVHGKGFLRADELSVDESMMPLYRKKEKISDYKKIDYEQFFDIKTKEWKYTHRTVADYLRDSAVIYNVYDETVSDGKYDVRHHKDFNRFNNDPNNLVFMSWHDHKLLHQNFGFSKESQELGTLAAKKKMADLKENHPKEYKKIQQRKSESSSLSWSKLSEDEAALQRKKISQGIRKNISQLSKEERKTRNKTSIANFRKGSVVVQHKLKHDPEFNAWFRQQQSNGWSDEARAKQSENFKIYNTNVKWGKNRELSLAQNRKKQKIDYSINMLNFIADCIKDKTSHQVTLNDVVYMLNNDGGMCEELSKLNSEKQVPNWNISMGFTPSIVKKIPVEFGYSSWMDFRKKKSVHNHRVVAIEYLDEEIEVGTLTIDNDELYHNYHTFALTCGVFTKNSNLGEIDDLRYFTNKLVRGLRIPSSYLPTGAEDGATSYNDGRVGTAYIQELRFNTYCERLQGLVIEGLNEEFKKYLLEKGVNIDTNMFDLDFEPPQNFASYRQAELDNSRVPTFGQMSAVPYISSRFALKRFLGLTDEEIAENEKLWREENDDSLGVPPSDAEAEMRGAGISSAGLDADLEGIEDEAPDAEGELGGDLDEPETATGGEPGGDDTI